MDVRGPTSGHLRTVDGARWPWLFLRLAYSKMFLVYLNGWAGKARGRVLSVKKNYEGKS